LRAQFTELVGGGMRFGPLGIMIQEALRAVAKPAVTIATLFGDFVNVVVDCFISIAE